MLRELQGALQRSILASDDSAPKSLIVQDRIAPEDRLAIYRNNTLASLIAVLEAAYPVLCHLVGEQNFRYAARRYVLASPPREPQLSVYGADFAEFLESFEPAQTLHYLPDLARFEWARNEAYFAADAAVLEPSSLQAMPAEHFPGLRFVLHPAVRLTQSRYPVLRIWEARRVPSPSGDPWHDSGCVLTTRPAAQVKSYPITRGNLTLLTALAAGLTLEEAAMEALAVEAGLDLQEVLTHDLSRGTFCAFVTEKPEGDPK